LIIGIINDVNALTDYSTEFQGAYREPAEFIQRLAAFYLSRNLERSDKLKEFGNIEKKCPESFMFVFV